MLIPKKHRLAIYSYLFKEGVLVTSVNVFAPKHMHLDVPNLHVIKLMQSLKSRNYVKERYNWRYLYFFLTNEGIEYLRETLHIPADTVPATLKRSDKPQPPPSFAFARADDDGPGGRGRGRRGGGGFRGRGGDRGRGGRFGDRDRDDTRGPKQVDDGAPRDFDPNFEGGGGRGRGGSDGFRGGSDGFRGRGRGRGRGEGRGRGAPVETAAAPADG